jgi:hypothetical protein
MTRIQTLRTFFLAFRPMRVMMALGLLLVLGFSQSGMAQTGTNQLNIFTNYFVTGDYVVSGWVEGPPDYSGYATGKITVPDPVQAPYLQTGVESQVPAGADIVAAFLYWSTVEGSKSTFAGQQGFFNGYPFSGNVLGNPNAPVSWSSGGCSGSAKGSKTIRTYRADVRPYLPLDTDPSSSTFGRIAPNTAYTVRLADSGSNGNTAPFTLGATLVLVYRVLNGNAPLNGIVLFDGIYAPSNAGQTISQTLYGFYQAALNPVAKLTHIVANGQPNKSQNVYLNTLSEPLPSLYGSLPPFPGKYGTWDNPTWVLTNYNGYVNPLDGPSETTQVIPTQSNTGCVTWGAMILSTTVYSTKGDGLLDVWKQGVGGVPGYTDAASNQWVSLPGAKSSQKDLFVEVDYASNMDGKAGSYLHSHLPKRDALDQAAAVLAGQGITAHFDLGPGIYAGDPNVVSYPVPLPSPLPTGTLPPQAGAGGNAISESALVCTDGSPIGTLCAYPGISTIGWKGGFVLTRDSVTQPNTNLPLGNFQPGRGQSYHYILVGHALGSARSFWSTLANALSGSINISNLVSIVTPAPGMGPGTAQVTLQSPPGLVKPGDCPNAAIPACSDKNFDRVSISGALGQQNLNGNYLFSNANPTTSNNVTTTTFTITTSGVAPGTYNFSNEPQLAVNYLGPTSTSGHSDFGGGGDSALTFGRWEADDTTNPDGSPNCQGDPSQPLGAFPAYCNNQVGTVQVQEGTLLHELGHTFTLTHGGAYYPPNNPTVPTYGANCKSNFLSVMNYLFQVRGFPDGGFDYSAQALTDLSEAALDESAGIGSNTAHFTRWYAPPNALDKQLQTTVGGRYATMHCDGTPIPITVPPTTMVRVDGTTFGSPIDWNNNLTVPDLKEPVAQQDVNFDGIAENSINPPPNPPNPLQGFNDKPAIDLTQIGARTGAAGFSGGGGGFLTQGGGGFLTQGGGGFLTQGGGGFLTQGGGGFLTQGGGGFLTQGGGGFLTQGGGGFLTQGGGVEQDSDMANSTADSPTGLRAGLSGHAVALNWTAPAFGQVREYDIWRATGSFTLQCVTANPPTCAFSDIKMLTPTPPTPSPSTIFTDTTVKNNTTYTYFVTDKNKQRVESGASNTATIYVKF